VTGIQVKILKKIAPIPVFGAPGEGKPLYGSGSRLAALMGDDFFSKIAGRTVIDFGCGEGTEATEMAVNGAARVIGIDIREDILQVGRRRALAAGVQNVEFSTSTSEQADIVVSVDAFEHFSDPAEILRIMSGLLKPGGEVRISFGPTWYHPLGGHLFSVFPWAHLIFSEKSLIEWRSSFRSDGATRFSEVAGGLNQMTIARFERLVADSPFRFAELELVPIGSLRPLHNRLTREFSTAVVRCRLVIK
jgi:SAM-dependent methyltransferase